MKDERLLSGYRGSPHPCVAPPMMISVCLSMRADHVDRFGTRWRGS